MTNKDYYTYSSKRTECPLCGSKDGRADIIFDKRTNIAYNENVGYFKCHSCGETRSPNIDPKFKDNDAWIKAEKPKINPNPKPQPKQKTANEIKAILNSNYNDSMANQNSNFHNWINNLSRDVTAFDTMEIGTDKIGATNFWYRDIDGNITYAKTMAYSENGERLKEDANPLKNADGTSKIALNGYVKGLGSKYPIYEYHIADLGYNTNGIFNYNRLAQGDYESIFVLESEKNCVLASICMPEYCFVTGGGSTAFTIEKQAIVEKFAIQFNKQVFVLYDLDKSGFDNTIAICNREFLITDFTSVFDEYMKSRKSIEVKSGFDVADFCKLVLERKIKKVHLIKELTKIYLSYFEEEKPKKDSISKPKMMFDKMEKYLKENYMFRHNIIKTRYEYSTDNGITWTWLDDPAVNTIFLQLWRAGIEVNQDKIYSAIQSSETYQFNVFEEWINSMPEYNPQTEPNYIQMLIDKVHAVGNDIEYPIEDENGNIEIKIFTPQQIWADYFTRWFVGIYAQAMQLTTSQFILILIGGGGIGKSQFAQKMLPTHLRQYITNFQFGEIDGNRDKQLQLCNNLILDCDELEGMGKVKQNAVKSIIGSNGYNVRPLYGRTPVWCNRYASFIGSSNVDTILADETGSRRYMMVTADYIDFKSIDDELISRAYKQAQYLAETLNFNIHFTQKEIAFMDTYNEEFRNTSLAEELIKQRFKPTESHSEGLTSGELFVRLVNLNSQVKEHGSYKISSILKKLGYTKKIVKQHKEMKRMYNIKEIIYAESYHNNYN